MNSILQNLYRLQTLDSTGHSSKTSEIAVLRAEIPEGMLTVYDRARARGKKGIAIVRNHVCTNCRMQAPVAVTASLRAGMVQTCGNCGLYLCLPEPDEQAAAAPVKAPAPARRRKQKTAG